MLDNYNGFVVEPRNSNHIVESLRKFTAENYNYYSSNALKSFDKFDSRFVNKYFFNEIEAI